MVIPLDRHVRAILGDEMKHRGIRECDTVDVDAGALVEFDHVGAMSHGFIRTKRVPPDLALAIDGAFAADFDVVRVAVTEMQS